MKKTYVRPVMEAEIFAANEVVAACGDTNQVYKFTCTAGGGVYGDVWQESNGVPGLQVVGGIDFENAEIYGADQKLTGGILGDYHACKKSHEASTDADFPYGYFSTSEFGTNSIPVRIWTNNNTNIHCTPALDMSSWETAKS